MQKKYEISNKKMHSIIKENINKLIREANEDVLSQEFQQICGTLTCTQGENLLSYIFEGESDMFKIKFIISCPETEGENLFVENMEILPKQYSADGYMNKAITESFKNMVKDNMRDYNTPFHKMIVDMIVDASDVEKNVNEAVEYAMGMVLQEDRRYIFKSVSTSCGYYLVKNNKDEWNFLDDTTDMLYSDTWFKDADYFKTTKLRDFFVTKNPLEREMEIGSIVRYKGEKCLLIEKTGFLYNTRGVKVGEVER